jgi:hypothetical protein
MVCTTCSSNPCAVLNIRFFYVDKSMFMDDIRRTLGMFVSLSMPVTVDSSGGFHAASRKRHK